MDYDPNLKATMRATDQHKTTDKSQETLKIEKFVGSESANMKARRPRPPSGKHVLPTLDRVELQIAPAPSTRDDMPLIQVLSFLA